MFKTRRKRSFFFGCTIMSMMAFFGCSQARRAPSKVSGAISYLSQSLYPHPAGWALPEQHGLSVLSTGQLNTGACAKSCHGENLQGASGPSCTKCHENYPHAEGWKTKEKHGHFFKQRGTANCATKCHGEDLTGGLSRIACNSCHSVYPHAKDFSEPANHGPLAFGQGKETCKNCHGTELRGVETTPSCYGCHKETYPHAKDWAEKTQHGNFVVKSGKETCATACHGKDLAGGLTNVSCSSCHSIYPHKAGFSNAENHGQLALGGGKASCALCHEIENAKSGTQGVPACTSCHAGVFPHAVDWAQKTNHGAWVVKNGKNNCATRCHGEDLKGGDSHKSCDGCHTLWPAEHQKAEWKTAPHGKKFRELGKSACYTCHLENPAPGALTKACSSCHSSLPKHEDTNWKTQGHGSFVAQAGTPECKSCHGPVLEDFCSKCHASYPAKHTPDWKQKAGGHNDYIKGTLKGDGGECKLCHGQDLKGGAVVKVGCTSCHAPGKTPHPVGKQQTMCLENPDDEMSDTMVPCVIDIPFSTTHGKDAKKSSTLCTLCHGSDYKGGIAGKSCFSCHNDSGYYPHQNSDWPKTGNHGVAYLKKYSRCNSACHGSDLIGGLSGVSCAKCHEAFPHNQTSWLDHGKTLLAGTGTLESKYVAKCGNCHGAIEKLDTVPPTTGYFTPTKIYRCRVCHNTFPHLGFKGKTFKMVDLTWKSGHPAYLLYSTEGFDLQSISTGCGGESPLGCHNNSARKGPHYSQMGDCTTYCHK